MDDCLISCKKEGNDKIHCKLRIIVHLVLQDMFRQHLFWFCGNKALPTFMWPGQKTKIKP